MLVCILLQDASNAHHDLTHCDDVISMRILYLQDLAVLACSQNLVCDTKLRGVHTSCALLPMLAGTPLLLPSDMSSLLPDMLPLLAANVSCAYPLPEVCHAISRKSGISRRRRLIFSRARPNELRRSSTAACWGLAETQAIRGICKLLMQLQAIMMQDRQQP